MCICLDTIVYYHSVTNRLSDRQKCHINIIRYSDTPLFEETRRRQVHPAHRNQLQSYTYCMLGPTQPHIHSGTGNA